MKDAELARLREVFGRYPEVAGVWLFGSHGHDTASARSDVDLALDPATPSGALEPSASNARDRKLDILADLVEAGFEHVDLVVLDRDDPVLRFEAIGPNRLVYGAVDYDPSEAFAQALRRYDDTARLRRLVREAYFEGLERNDR